MATPYADDMDRRPAAPPPPPPPPPPPSIRRMCYARLPPVVVGVGVGVVVVVVVVAVVVGVGVVVVVDALAQRRRLGQRLHNNSVLVRGIRQREVGGEEVSSTLH
jgi:hypothetical protein